MKTNAVAPADTYYSGLCMPMTAARTQQGDSPRAATISAAANGYNQYAPAAAAGSNYGTVAGSPAQTHQYPLHFGESSERQIYTQLGL